MAFFLKSSQRLYPWVVAGMLWLIGFLNFADRQVIYSIFPLLEKEFHFSKFQLGLIGSAFLWVYAVFGIFAGIFSDRYCRKRTIIGGCFFWSLMTWGTAWCSQFWQFVVVRGLDGIGEAFYLPAAMSLLADYHGSKTRSTAFSFHFSGIFLGIIAGSSLGAFLAQHFGWRFSFYFFGGLGILLSFVFSKWLREPVRGASEKETPEALISSSANKNYYLEIVGFFYKRPEALLLMLAFGSESIVSYAFFTWLPTFFYEKFHLSLAASGFSAALYLQLGCIAGTLFFGKITDRFLSNMQGGRLLSQMIGLVIGTFFILFIGKATSVNALIVVLFCFGFGKGGYVGGMFPALYETVSVHQRGMASGFNSFVGSIAGGLGPAIIGAIITFGKTGTTMERMSHALSWSAFFYVLTICFLIGAFFLNRRKAHYY
jgi:MFS family permease